MLKSAPLATVLLFHLITFSCSLNEEGTNLLQLPTLLSFTNPTWSAADATPCSWDGVTCDRVTGSVTGLDLSNTAAAGMFPAAVLSGLPKLSRLSFNNASLNSTLPSDISACKSLTYLDLSQNYLTGKIPATLAELPLLAHLDLAGNNFSGEIPAEFGGFRRLEVLSLVANLLTGVILPSLGNISTLRQLNLSYNPFFPGNIPAELGNLRNLEILWLTECNLEGEIPGPIGRLAKLRDLDLASNRLVGGIPESLSGLVSVTQIELYNNSLTGEIPSFLGNLTTLRQFDASMNRLTGRIPEQLARLPLSSLNLYENMLEGTIPGSIAFSPNLYELRLFNNFFTGELPRYLGRNSPLTYLEVSNNQFTGEIPRGLCDNWQLSELILLNNSFTGTIPDGLKNCASLTRVRLSENRLSGEVPASFWGLPNVVLLDLADNQFSGGISRDISGAGELSSLTLDGNLFNGSIPEEMGELVNLEKFSASKNELSGKLPATLTKLTRLGSLDLHENRLTGEMPVDMNRWSSMNELNLANNRLSGSIPDSIGDFSVLTYLDLSNNVLSGKIPASLGNLKLNQLNLANNMLSGPIPSLYANEIYEPSFIGNPGLCGYMKNLCNDRRKSKGGFNVWLLRLILAISVAILVGGLVWFYIRFRRLKRGKSYGKSKWTLMSFHKVDFNEEEILNSLDEDNVVGSGASGKVYKVVLSNGETVAVKKFWKEKSGENEFSTEVGTLGKIRHKSIVKLWSCCSTADHKFLVYEFMANGSLGDLLHSNKGGLLEWPTRFTILMDAAEGLSYLHHDCSPPIVHRDVKANNILLDGEFRAKLADFGVAKAFEEMGKESMSIIAGSCGYIAPEYSYTLRVNEKSDIYSFGVVILEMVTGKLPVDVEYGERDLVKWVNGVVEQKGEDHVIDPKLNAIYKEEVCEVLHVGRLCTSHLPINRPSMRSVVKLLKEIWAENHSKDSYVDGKDHDSFHTRSYL